MADGSDDSPSGDQLPALANGMLPEGVHDCTLAALEERFGRFTTSDRRVTLFRELEEYWELVRDLEFVVALVVDGSFVTDKPQPSDVDLLLVVRDSVELSDVPPYQYNLISKKRVRSRFKFDLFLAKESSAVLHQWTDFFSNVKGNATARKGMLRLVP